MATREREAITPLRFSEHEIRLILNEIYQDQYNRAKQVGDPNYIRSVKDWINDSKRLERRVNER